MYAVFGSSGQLTIGSVILVSLFIAEAFRELGIPMGPDLKGAVKDYAEYVKAEMAAVISVAVGVRSWVGW